MRKALLWSVVVISLFVFGACNGGGGGGKTTKLFGITIGGRSDETSVLVLLSPNDGSFISTIGDVGYRVNGLEYDHVTNKLYGSTSARDAVFPLGLIEINMGTAAATTIGPAGMHLNNPTVNSAGEMYAWTEGSADDLIMVNSSTGLATIVGDSGLDSSEHGLAFDNSDDLYFVNYDIQIYTMDTASGAATFFTDLDTANDYAHHGDFHPETGYYWGIGETWGNLNGPYSPNFIVIDMNTPAIIDSTLSTVDNLHAITFFRD